MLFAALPVYAAIRNQVDLFCRANQNVKHETTLDLPVPPVLPMYIFSWLTSQLFWMLCNVIKLKQVDCSGFKVKLLTKYPIILEKAISSLDPFSNKVLIHIVHILMDGWLANKFVICIVIKRTESRPVVFLLFVHLLSSDFLFSTRDFFQTSHQCLYSFLHND